MGWNNTNYITKTDLGVAYRKAKADLYYERTCPYLESISTYEENLAHNLDTLFEQLQTGNFEWLYPSLDNAWTVIPKSISEVEDNTENSSTAHCLYSNPMEQWKVQRKTAKYKAEFRLVGNPPIDFHIISALWIMKVGHRYDAVLGEEAYGSRLRRVHSDNPEQPGEPNPLSLGTFKHYLQYYKQWRENGLAAMEQGIEDEKRVAAVTADLRLFYHSLCPRFLLNKKYLKKINLTLSRDEKLFTQELIKAIEYWAKQTPLHEHEPHKGLPVGLSASRLIANVALAELDRVIMEEIQPLYYGRYVDDIILVLKGSKKFKEAKDIWLYLRNRSKKLLKIETTGDKKKELVIRFAPKYLEESDLKFMGKKQKAFLLQGASGRALVDSIRRQINEQASEWRRLPQLEQSNRVATTLITASGDDGKAVDSLRKTDDLSIRRAGFAIYLRDFEAFEQDLEPTAWKGQRKVFFDTVCRHFLCPSKLFNYAMYIPRLLGLAVSCRDYTAASQVLKSLEKSIKRIEKDCELGFAGNSDAQGNPLEIWKEYLNKSLYESFVAALSPSHQNDKAAVRSTLEEMGRSYSQSIFTQAKSWCARDLMRRPYRMRYMPYVRDGECWQDVVKDQFEDLYDYLFEQSNWEGVLRFTGLLDKNNPNPILPMAMLFPTRPFTVGEMYMLVFGMAQAKPKELNNIQEWAKAFRGFSTEEESPQWQKEGTLVIANRSPGRKIRVALGCLDTKYKSWKAAVKGLPEPDASRYQRINHLVNNAISSRKKIDYLVLPELSVPPRWFSRMAIKLAQNRISFIAGVDYLHHPGKKRVANQAWASLCTDYLGFPQTIIYRQDKTRLAQGEERDIWQLAGQCHKIMSPKRKKKPIIIHGDFHFTILICSELTNIKHRARLRGKVDTVFVPEWNMDADTFSALVEASALDIHAYITQCNDRKYGDSRIRSPHRDKWMRDLVRVKGGIEDYLVIGEIDVNALREFQFDYRSSPKGPFKPIPDGFRLSTSRQPVKAPGKKG